MGVFHSWSRTWIFKIGIGSLPMCCQSAEYPEPLKNLDRLACTKAFPQTPSPVFTAIHPINTTGLFNYRIRKLLVVWRHYYSLLSFYFLEFVPNTSQVHTLFSIYPSRCHKPLKHPVDNIKINLQSPHETLRNHQSHSNNPHASHALIYHYSNIPFTRWIGKRHLNVVSGSCSPNVDYEMLLLCSGI